MKFSAIRKSIADHLVNRAGWKTDRKIVVIESDDWGSIRMPSPDVYNRLARKGIPVKSSPYCRYDSLASESDLEALFECLKRYRDSMGNHPQITANCVVSNPDFEKIENSNFQEYFFEPICETFGRYPEHKDCLDLWRQGNQDGVFHPQSHGREHLNTIYWLKLLQEGHNHFREAFEARCWGLSHEIYPGMKRSIQASLDMEDPCEIEEHKQIVREALHLFEDLFGYRSLSFIANNYIWSEALNKVLSEEGVKYLQGMKYQKLPIYNQSKRKMIRRYVGDKNEAGQYHLVRNCAFEPSLKPMSFNNVDSCLKSISNAFFWSRPAIICSHRINYVGYLNTDNRDRNLYQIDKLLAEVTQRWPDVEFMTSDQLGRVIELDTEKNGSR